MIELTPGEKIQLMIRKHWMVIAKDVVILGAIVCAPLIVYLIVSVTSIEGLLTFDGDARLVWIFLSSLWLLLTWTMFFIAWTDYYLDILIITDERVFDIEQKGLFNRQSSEFRLDRIQDVTVEVKGVLPTLFKFGHIHIQTAGEKREFIATYIPNPYNVKELIMHKHDAAMEKMRPAHLR